MISQKITFLDSSWNKIVGILSRPSNTYDMPIVIACHGFSSSKESTTYMNLEKNLISKNIAIFRFDFFGHGESEWDFSKITLSRAIDSTLKAFELLKEKWFQYIWLFGSSFGGCVALNVASILDNRLDCLVCKCPVSDYAKKTRESKWEKGMKKYKEKWYYLYDTRDGRDYKVNYSFYEDMEKNNAHIHASSISIPTLIVHGDADKVVDVKQSRHTATLIKKCTYHEIHWAWHSFNTPTWTRKTIQKSFLDFFVKHM